MNIMQITSFALSIGSMANDTSNMFFSETNCESAKDTIKIIGYTVLNLISPFFLRSKKTSAVEALVRNLDTICKIVTKYRLDPSSIHIRNHVGTFYQLEWENNGKSLSFDNSKIHRLGLAALIS